jgi:glycosyltransferase involved in cell wall biosynthesis
VINSARVDAGSSPPDVTVVVPVWDSYVQRFLDDALESLKQQDLGARIVVVDNASRVEVPQTAGVEIVRAERRLTVGAARNLGLALTETPYVVFWDADDVILPGTLRSLRDRLAAEPETVLAATAILEQSSGSRPHHWPRPITRPLANVPGLFTLVHCVSSLFPTTGSVMIRTGLARDAGGFADADGGDDWVLGVSLALRGRVSFEHEVGRLYRRHPDSLSAEWRASPHLIRHARQVRARLRSDPRTPRWLRTTTAALALFQLGVIFGLRPLAHRVRSRVPSDRAVSLAGVDPVVAPRRAQ